MIEGLLSETVGGMRYCSTFEATEYVELLIESQASLFRIFC